MILSSNDVHQLSNENDMYYLTIKKAGAEVMGTYVITANNSAGKISAEIDLNVAGILLDENIRIFLN